MGRAGAQGTRRSGRRTGEKAKEKVWANTGTGSHGDRRRRPPRPRRAGAIEGEAGRGAYLGGGDDDSEKNGDAAFPHLKSPKARAHARRSMRGSTEPTTGTQGTGGVGTHPSKDWWGGTWGPGGGKGGEPGTWDSDREGLPEERKEKTQKTRGLGAFGTNK